MDAQHRHELKENDLVEFLTHFGQWWSKYGNVLLVVVCLVSAVILGRRWMVSQAASAREAALVDLAGATDPQSYRRIALTYDDQLVRSLAFLRGGDLFLTEAQSGVTPSDVSTPPADGQPIPQPLDDAVLMYNQVLQAADVPFALALNARLGLAAVAETRGDWEQADEQYTQVLDKAGPGYERIAAQAKAKQVMLDRMKIPVKFAGVSLTNPVSSLQPQLTVPVQAPATPSGDQGADPTTSTPPPNTTDTDTPDTPIDP